MKFFYHEDFGVNVSLLELAFYYEQNLFSYYMNRGFGSMAYALADLAGDKNHVY